MDYITIDNLHVHGAHGHYEHERQVEQEFVVSLKVGIDAHPSGESDVLGDTIDYDGLRAIVGDIFNGKSHYLVEALAEEISQRILSETIAQEVTISIQKTAVWPNGVPGIVTFRRK
ncbi:MAG: dihydroneopterin aldolase [Candidatus Pacebacteria bacterium]|nr:dihydroneopterin aldolase [Candidatus Paceibacterota bacterium]